jgi:hypothetical protein
VTSKRWVLSFMTMGGRSAISFSSDLLLDAL